MNKVAEILEKAAAYIEQLEQANAAYREKEASETRQQLQAKLPGADEDLLDKLAAADPGIRQYIEGLISQEGDGWGGPAKTASSNTTGMSRDEAAAAADQHFLNWILS